MVTILIVLLIISIVPGFWAIGTFNRIVKQENRVGNAWSQIDVQLKKRNDLIPNLVESVKGYAAHEKGIFEEVAASRQALMGAQGVGESAKATNMMEAALGRLFAIAENYPDLKASENFQVLQEELSAVENKIAYARQFYNDAVLSFNNTIETIPGVLFAGPMNKQVQVYLDIPETERQVPQVSFN